MAFNPISISIAIIEIQSFRTCIHKKLLLPLWCKLKQDFLLDLEKLIEYWASAANVVSSNLCVGHLPRIKIYVFSLSICTDELISTPKIMKFLPMLPSGNDNSERESNPIP